VDPGALVAYVRELKKVLVEPGLLASVAEEWLVGTRRARRHDHAVEFMLLDRVFIALIPSSAHV
jgi:hypothetical protein